MSEARVVTAIQRATSTIPGAAAIRRRLRNSAAGCGLTYWLSTIGEPSGFRIIMYHRIVEELDPYYTPASGYDFSVALPVFDAQLRLFKRFCAVLSLDEIAERLDRGRPLPARCLALTFDDGYRDNGRIAWPLLRRYRLPAAIYVATQAMERGFLWPDVIRHAIRRTRASWLTLESLPSGPLSLPLATDDERLRAVARLDAALKTLPPAVKQRALEELVATLLGISCDRLTIPGLMLSRDEVKTLAAEGLTIGAHSVTHPVLWLLPEPDAAREIDESRRCLADLLGRSVRHFAYPHGHTADLSPSVVEMVRRAGFATACTTVDGFNQPSADRWRLKRIQGARVSVRALTSALTESRR